MIIHTVLSSLQEVCFQLTEKVTGLSRYSDL